MSLIKMANVLLDNKTKERLYESERQRSEDLTKTFIENVKDNNKLRPSLVGAGIGAGLGAGAGQLLQKNLRLPLAATGGFTGLLNGTMAQKRTENQIASLVHENSLDSYLHNRVIKEDKPYFAQLSMDDDRIKSIKNQSAKARNKDTLIGSGVGGFFGGMGGFTEGGFKNVAKGGLVGLGIGAATGRIASSKLNIDKSLKKMQEVKEDRSNTMINAYDKNKYKARKFEDGKWIQV